MKCFVLIAFLHTGSLFCQQDYYHLYSQITDSINNIKKIIDSHYKLMDQDTTIAKDTALLNKVYKQHEMAHNRSVIPLFKNVINKTFPDITFTDKNFNNYNISDFADYSIVINYNYLYCKPCLDRIDSTLKIIENKKFKMIVLLKDVYRKDVYDLNEYNDKILVGFMGDDTANLISFETGYDRMYLLIKKRVIRYFDGIEPKDYKEKWLNFLKAYHEN